MNYFVWANQQAERKASRSERAMEILDYDAPDLADTIRTHLDQQRLGIIVEEGEMP